MDTSTQTGKVLWHCTMSLDGFVAGPGHSMDWMAGDFEHRPGVEEESSAVLGAVLGGRRGWDATPGDGRPYGDWEGPIFVLTHHPEDARTRDDVTFLNCDVAEAIRIARDAAGGKNVEILSADISRQAILAGLLDEIYVHIMPVLIGDGIRFFEQPDMAPVRWRRVGVNTEVETVELRYAPVR